MKLAILLALSAPLSFPAAQQAEDADRPPLVTLTELEVVQYRPQHVDVYELQELVSVMLGRTLFVKERGGYQSTPVSNVRILGDALVLYDTRPQLDRLLSALKELDQPDPEAEEPEEEQALVAYNYVPRYLTLEAVSRALESFERQVQDHENWVDNFSASRDRSLFVIRESPERLAEILEVLRRMDVPQPQVVVTCHLIRGGGGQDDGVPEELLRNLKLLLPDTHFQAVGFSMIQTSVTPSRNSIGMLVEDRTGSSFHMNIRPTAFDTETSSLSMECEVTNLDHEEVLFRTSTVLRGGEYTVLGATGAEPIFVVLQVTPVGRAG